MFDLVVVTNRMLCSEDFLCRIESIAKQQPQAIILREKDLSETEYEDLATKVIAICNRYGTKCILHSFVNVALQLEHKSLHVPINILRKMSEEERAYFAVLGASCHSVEEAIEAQRLGCSYITAGHIYATDCKQGVPPRGIAFLKEVCECVKVPVYAIGGINAQNVEAVRTTKAQGACVMSSVMQCPNIEEYFKRLGE